jgi:mycoredoxin
MEVPQAVSAEGITGGKMEQGSEKENGTVIIYGHRYCSQAKLLRNTLDQQQIDYEWRDIREADPIYQEELRDLANGNLSVPTVVLPNGMVLIEPLPGQVLKLLKPARGLLSKIADLFTSQPD